MNTFHIKPSDELAVVAVGLVQQLANQNPDCWVAVRGQVVNDGEEQLYTVCQAPADSRELGGRTDYIWPYVPAKEWLEEFTQAQCEEVVVTYGNLVAELSFPPVDCREHYVAGVGSGGQVDPVELVEWLQKWNFQPSRFSGKSRVVMFAPTGGYCYLHGERYATHDINTGISLVVKERRLG